MGHTSSYPKIKELLEQSPFTSSDQLSLKTLLTQDLEAGEKIDLSHIYLATESCQRLAAALNQINFTRAISLDLSFTSIKDKEITIIASALKNKTVSTLSLHSNQISNIGLEKLIEALAGKQLETLDLTYNTGLSTSSPLLQKALRERKLQVKSLKIARTGISTEDQQTIESIIQSQLSQTEETTESNQFDFVRTSPGSLLPLTPSTPSVQPTPSAQTSQNSRLDQHDFGQEDDVQQQPTVPSATATTTTTAMPAPSTSATTTTPVVAPIPSTSAVAGRFITPANIVRDFLTGSDVGYRVVNPSESPTVATIEPSKHNNSGYQPPLSGSTAPVSLPADYEYFVPLLNDEAFLNAVEPLFQRYVASRAGYQYPANSGPYLAVYAIQQKKQFLVLMYEAWKRGEKDLERVQWDISHGMSFRFHPGLEQRISNFVREQAQPGKPQSAFFSQFIHDGIVDVAAYVVSLQQRRFARATDKGTIFRVDQTPAQRQLIGPPLLLDIGEGALASQVAVAVSAVALNGMMFTNWSGNVDSSKCYNQRSMNLTGPRLEPSACNTPLYQLLIVTPNTTQSSGDLQAINAKFYGFSKQTEYLSFQKIDELYRRDPEHSDYICIAMLPPLTYGYLRKLQYQEYLERCFQMQLEEQQKIEERNGSQMILINDGGIGQGVWLPPDTNLSKDYGIPIYVEAWKTVLRQFSQQHPQYTVILNLNCRGLQTTGSWANQCIVGDTSYRDMTVVPLTSINGQPQTYPYNDGPYKGFLILAPNNSCRFSVDGTAHCFIQFSNAGYADFPGLPEQDKRHQRNFGMAGDALAMGANQMNETGHDASLENSFGSGSSAAMTMNDVLFAYSQQMALEYGVHVSIPAWNDSIQQRKQTLEKALQSQGIQPTNLKPPVLDVLAFALLRLEGYGQPSLTSHPDLRALAIYDAQQALKFGIEDIITAQPAIDPAMDKIALAQQIMNQIRPVLGESLANEVMTQEFLTGLQAAVSALTPAPTVVSRSSSATTSVAPTVMQTPVGRPVEEETPQQNQQQPVQQPIQQQQSQDQPKVSATTSATTEAVVQQDPAPIVSISTTPSTASVMGEAEISAFKSIIKKPWQEMSNETCPEENETGFWNLFKQCLTGKENNDAGKIQGLQEVINQLTDQVRRNQIKTIAQQLQLQGAYELQVTKAPAAAAISPATAPAPQPVPQQWPSSGVPAIATTITAAKLTGITEDQAKGIRNALIVAYKKLELQPPLAETLMADHPSWKPLITALTKIENCTVGQVRRAIQTYATSSGRTFLEILNITPDKMDTLLTALNLDDAHASGVVDQPFIQALQEKANSLTSTSILAPVLAAAAASTTTTAPQPLPTPVLQPAIPVSQLTLTDIYWKQQPQVQQMAGETTQTTQTPQPTTDRSDWRMPSSAKLDDRAPSALPFPLSSQQPVTQFTPAPQIGNRTTLDDSIQDQQTQPVVSRLVRAPLAAPTTSSSPVPSNTLPVSQSATSRTTQPKKSSGLLTRFFNHEKTPDRASQECDIRKEILTKIQAQCPNVSCRTVQSLKTQMGKDGQPVLNSDGKPILVPDGKKLVLECAFPSHEKAEDFVTAFLLPTIQKPIRQRQCGDETNYVIYLTTTDRIALLKKLGYENPIKLEGQLLSKENSSQTSCVIQ